MSLGVLNNISAVYAENALNNSQNNLSKTLQDLSSGSRINSGADDAAGLSLVDGLQANQSALTQSKTNAQEGVGLLQVADGALSQVTSLLNRAVTLATEASNGTLNSTQDAAANQEYQSILSEVSNIGSTTTYNDQAVFNSVTNIYSGDASSVGASVDALNIRTLSSSNLGDSSGAITYTNGQGNVFIDLSNGNATTDATQNDALVSGANITVNYEALGGNGLLTPETATIAVGGSTGYANTAAGMVSAINHSNLGLTATFGTAKQAGATTGNLADTGIIINGPGSGVGAGTTPDAVGALTLSAALDGDEVLSGTLSVTDSTGVAHSITLGTNGSTDTLANLKSTINNAGYGITASVNGGNTVMSFTSASSKAAISGASLTTTDPAEATLSYAAATPYYSVGVANGGTGVYDSGDGQTTDVTYSANASGAGAVATISYADNAGENLSTTDLSSQSDAQTALTNLNTAIADVAAQDGYLGAQINTLNAVSSVLSTQQENVQSAQNAVQATDYAQAASSMSKYEILSQTGISALAQANSSQQEVLKLLQ